MKKIYLGVEPSISQPCVSHMSDLNTRSSVNCPQIKDLWASWAESLMRFISPQA
jgi:hypothetical protein